MTSLATANIVAIDCQTTGASPQRGHLLELGWALGQATSPRPAALGSRLVALPAGEGVPAAITRVTGIDDDALVDAVAPAQAWQELVAAARPAAFAVIHYARFELGFLHELHAACAPQQPFGIEVVCSHRVAARLLPELPRRGLRAVAGYYGLGLDVSRRAGGHARATVFVWHHLVAELARHGITESEQLLAWLDDAPAKRRGRKLYPMPRLRRLNVPEQPGVYRMRRATGELLYVGKATCLRRRVNSYFQKQSGVAERTLEMLSQARDVDVTVTATAVEAALLESDEIKRQAPPYNVALVEPPGQLAFCDRRFRIASGPRRWLGPLRRAADVLVLGAMADVLAGRQPAVVLAELFCEREPPPSDECVQDAVRLCRAEWFGGVDVSTADTAAAALRRLAAQLWQQKLETETETETETECPPPPPAHWTPTRIADTLTAIVCRAGQSLRRARWLCDLSESSVMWREGAQWRVLQICAGDIAVREWRRETTAAPLPLDPERPVAERQRGFTTVRYDRLRVLTTELRRLVADGVSVEVCFGTARRLHGDRLARALRWV